MSERSDNPFEPRLGRMRSAGNAKRGRTFMSRVARSVSRAGPSPGTTGRKRSSGGGKHARRVVVKARFIRSAMSSSGALAQHLKYISRDSAMKAEDKGRVFDAANEDVDRQAFAESAEDDRHHFRFIVSPEDGAELADMKPFIRDLMSRMETDLETRLDWVAAVHDNTDHPHAHIVIRGRRDDGGDLVMPRAYISHGVRERAEELVMLELGPETQHERDVKLAREVKAERLTQIDRSLGRMAGEDRRLDLSKTPARYRVVNAARLRTLNSLGLARQIKGSIWELSDGFDETLKELGDRKDIIKQIHKALGGRVGRQLEPGRPFAGAAGRAPITGSVLRTGLGGDGHDEPFVVLDAVDGRAVSARVKSEDVHATLRPGMIVTLSPPDVNPRPSDHSIAEIAGANAGTYSAALHQASDPRASPTFIGAHIRRLEALRRVGISERLKDGTWRIPGDYLEQIRKHQIRAADRFGADVAVESWAGLSDQIEAPGLTWLDQTPLPDVPAYGFADEVRTAHALRRARLLERGLVSDARGDLDPSTRETLRRLGLEAAGSDIAAKIGKPYMAMPTHGTIEGVYRKSITRPEGKFSIIARQRNFTLVPWRQAMERARGQAISGVVRGQSISWKFGRQKGRTI